MNSLSCSQKNSKRNCASIFFFSNFFDGIPLKWLHNSKRGKCWILLFWPAHKTCSWKTPKIVKFVQIGQKIKIRKLFSVLVFVQEVVHGIVCLLLLPLLLILNLISKCAQKEGKWYYWIFFRLSWIHPVSSKVVQGIVCLLFLFPLLLVNLAPKLRGLSGITYSTKTTKGKGKWQFA